MENDLHDLHQRLILLMNEVHRICMENNIQYTMMGGTLIGAMRHKGFIPWDDDFDIGMTYDNYQRFINVAFKLQHDWVEFYLAGRQDDFYCPFIKIYDKRTTLVQPERKPRGIFIDLFPIVPAGNSMVTAKLQFFRHRVFMATLVRKQCDYKGFSVDSLLCKIGKFISVSTLMNLIQKQYESLAKKHRIYVSDMDGNTHGIVPSRLFEHYSLYPFEDSYFMGITKADEYLRLDFGDYMKIPPKEKQVPHHIEYLNLNLPYCEYKKVNNV